jgi:hypothetical protein
MHALHAQPFWALLPVRKYCPARRWRRNHLTILSNVVAYACRPSLRKERHDIHQHRRLIRRSAIGGRRREPTAECAAEMAERAETSNPWETGASPTMVRSGGNRRKLAETCFGDPIAVRKYSRAHGSCRRAELLAIGISLAETAQTPTTNPTGVWRWPSLNEAEGSVGVAETAQSPSDADTDDVPATPSLARAE